MVDVSKTVSPKSDQLNSDDLIGGSITIKISKVSGKSEPSQPIAINFDGDNGKPYLPCKIMRRVLVQIWGNDGNGYVGKSMTLYRDPEVIFGGIKVGGIRISHMSDMSEKVTMALTMSKANKKPFTVQPLKQQTTVDPALLAEGKNAAGMGVAAYTEWLAGLTADVKATMKPHHADLSKAAKEADAQKPINAEGVI